MDLKMDFCWADMEKHLKRVSKEFKLAFISACVIGLIVHLYVFSNLLLGNDAASNAFTDNLHLSSGRWALSFFSSFSSIYQMPVVIGVISIVMLALTAGLTVRVLEISHPAGIILTSALLVSFPAVACTFAYMFTADAYFIALFMNAAAVYLAKNHRFGWVPAILLIATACGIYQAYICYAIGLFLFDCILALLFQEDIKAILFRGGKYILILIAGLFLYISIQKILMSYYNVSLTSYMGMDTIGRLDMKARLAAIPKAYKIFLSYFTEYPYITSFWRLFQWGSVLIASISLLRILIVKKLYQNLIRTVLIAAGCLLIPLALDFVAVLAYSASVHRLMIYAFVLFYVFSIKCAELAAQQAAFSPGKFRLPIYTVCGICCAVIAWNNFCLSNIGYHSLQLCYENSFALANRIAVRIEMLDGYSAGDPVAIVGYPSWDLYGNGSNYTDYNKALGGEMNFNLVVYKQFFRHYIGLHIPGLSTEQYAELENSETVSAMPVYPAKGSVAMVDGIAVVKLEEGGRIQTDRYDFCDRPLLS